MAGRKLTQIRLSEAAALHYDYLQTINLQPNTVRTTQSVLRAFEQIVGNKVVVNIDWQDVTIYFNTRNQDPIRPGGWAKLSPATLNLQMSRLRVFFDWAVKFHYLDSGNDPMAGRRLIKIVPENRARLEPQEFPLLLDAAKSPRDRILLALGLYTMMRAGEILGLRIGDLSLPNSSLQMVRYKTKERDELAICTELRIELANYLRYYSNNVGAVLENDWWLVPTNERRAPQVDPATHRFAAAPLDAIRLVPTRPLPKGAPPVIVQRALASIGWNLTAREGGHTLRRSAARELFETLRSSGFDDALLVVMSWLGHKSPLVTMKYLGLQREAERRNKLYKDAIMYPRVTGESVAQPLRAVE